MPGEIEQEGGQEYDIRAPGEAAVLLQKLDQLDLLPVVLGRLINVFTYREPEHIEVSNNRVYTKRFLAEMDGAVHMSPLKTPSLHSRLGDIRLRRMQRSDAGD